MKTKGELMAVISEFGFDCSDLSADQILACIRSSRECRTLIGIDLRPEQRRLAKSKLVAPLDDLADGR